MMMQNLTKMCALLVTIGSFAQVGFAAPTVCFVQAWENNHAVSTLAQTASELNAGKALELFREGDLSYVVAKDEQGGVQLSIADVKNTEVIAIAKSSTDNSLSLIASKPLRSITCATPRP
jgi:hypothetical protein